MSDIFRIGDNIKVERIHDKKSVYTRREQNGSFYATAHLGHLGHCDLDLSLTRHRERQPAYHNGECLQISIKGDCGAVLFARVVPDPYDKEMAKEIHFKMYGMDEIDAFREFIRMVHLALQEE